MLCCLRLSKTDDQSNRAYLTYIIIRVPETGPSVETRKDSEWHLPMPFRSFFLLIFFHANLFFLFCFSFPECFSSFGLGEKALRVALRLLFRGTLIKISKCALFLFSLFSLLQSLKTAVSPSLLMIMNLYESLWSYKLHMHYHLSLALYCQLLLPLSLSCDF